MKTLLMWVVLVVGLAAQGQDFGSVAVVGNLFHPREIAGINVHWDASTLQGVTGTTVSNWVDAVSGISASNVVVSTCPQLVYTNGVKALRFDGVDDYLDAGTNTLNLLTNTWSMFCVGSMSSAANQTFFSKSYAGPGGGRYALIKESSIEIIYELYQSGSSPGTFTPSGIFAVDTYWNRYYGHGFKTNGVLCNEALKPAWSTAVNHVTAYSFVFGNYPNGTTTGYVLPLNGLFCEFISVKRNGSNWVSSVESRKINEYFQNKYRLQRISRL